MPRATKQEKAAARAKRKEMLRGALAIVTKGVCPQCGEKLFRNLSLSGWFQCGHYGAPGFQRAPGPNCNYQMFYDPTPEEHAELLAERPGVDADLVLEHAQAYLCNVRAELSAREFGEAFDTLAHARYQISSKAYRVTTKIPYHNYVRTFTDGSEMRSWVYHNTGVNLPTCPEAAFLGKHKTARGEGEVIVEAVRL